MVKNIAKKRLRVSAKNSAEAFIASYQSAIGCEETYSNRKWIKYS